MSDQEPERRDEPPTHPQAMPYAPPAIWPAPPPPRPGVPTAALITLVGGALIVCSAFLVWATITEPGGVWEIRGMDGGRDGVIALLVGAATIAAGIAAVPATAGAFTRRAPIALGLLAAITAIANLADIEQQARHAALWSSDYQWTHIETGPGLYVLLVGAITATLAGCAPRKR